MKCICNYEIIAFEKVSSLEVLKKFDCKSAINLLEYQTIGGRLQ